MYFKYTYTSTHSDTGTQQATFVFKPVRYGGHFFLRNLFLPRRNKYNNYDIKVYSILP